MGGLAIRPFASRESGAGCLDRSGPQGLHVPVAVVGMLMTQEESLVAAGFSVRVHPGGRGEFGDSVGAELNEPVTMVDDPVMKAANQDGVFEAGEAAGCPVGDVVSFGPSWSAVAAGERASCVAGDEGSAEGAGDQAL